MYPQYFEFVKENMWVVQRFSNVSWNIWTMCFFTWKVFLLIFSSLAGRLDFLRGFFCFVCVCVFFFLILSYMSELLKKIFKRRLENCNFPLWNNWGFSWLVLDIPNLLDKKSTTEIWNSSKVYTLPWIFWSIFSCGLLLQVRLSF